MGLEVDSVTVRFGGNLVLDQVSLDAHAGHVTALIGPNGAGKTTLFNVITGVLKPQSGRISLNGRDLTNMSAHARVRSGMGRTFQRLELFGTLTVSETLRVAASRAPRSQRHQIVEAIIDRLDLGPIADVRTDSLPTGTGRVVELARALVGNPSVLLLDEPASGQDDEETARFSALLAELASEGMTILLVEHDMDLVMNISDRIHVLDFGHVIASGTAMDVRADPAVQAAYLGEVVA